MSVQEPTPQPPEGSNDNTKTEPSEDKVACTACGEEDVTQPCVPPGLAQWMEKPAVWGIMTRLDLLILVWLALLGFLTTMTYSANRDHHVSYTVFSETLAPEYAREYVLPHALRQECANPLDHQIDIDCNLLRHALYCHSLPVQRPQGALAAHHWDTAWMVCSGVETGTAPEKRKEMHDHWRDKARKYVKRILDADASPSDVVSATVQLHLGDEAPAQGLAHAQANDPPEQLSQRLAMTEYLVVELSRAIEHLSRRYSEDNLWKRVRDMTEPIIQAHTDALGSDIDEVADALEAFRLELREHVVTHKITFLESPAKASEAVDPAPPVATHNAVPDGRIYVEGEWRYPKQGDCYQGNCYI